MAKDGGKPEGRRILVTGGAGFVGLGLVRALAGANEVVVLDNLHPQVHPDRAAARARTEASGASLVEADIRDGAALSRLFGRFRPDIVFHLAAETGTGQSHAALGRHVDVNVVGTTRLIETIRRAEARPARIVLASSRAVYGQGAMVDRAGQPALALPRKRTMLEQGCFDIFGPDGQKLYARPTSARSCLPNPVSIYASTKLMQEHLVTQGLWGSGIETVILRLHNAYGPGQSLANPYTGVLAHFARLAIRGQPIEIYEDGRIVRDFVHLEDVVRALLRAASCRPPPPLPIDIGTGRPVTLAALVRLLLRRSGNRAPCRVSGAFQPGDVRHAVADPANAARFLGWSPTVDLETGLADVLRWVREELSCAPHPERPPLHPVEGGSPCPTRPCPTRRYLPSATATSPPFAAAGST